MVVSKDKVEEILHKYDSRADSLVPILMDAQDICDDHYVDEETQKYIAQKLNLTYVDVYEVSSFFSAINKTSKGKYFIQLCDSSVCRINKKDIIEDYLEKTLGISVGETTPDNMFTLEQTACFGACDISPAIRINKKVYGHLTIQKVKHLLEDLRGADHE
ncbi:MAG: NAD(P)H-dependent oxidoreductase subunit E [Clostridiales bacterium]|nr:NAD(P)H-dependent oxidoreductase subunit E [Clostridiales bacterium]